MRFYFNGSKSIYLRVSHKCFTAEPMHRLDARYAALVCHLAERLPQELRSRIDFSIYEATRLLRIPGTRYPGGGFMNVVTEESLRSVKVLETLRGLALPPMEEPDPFFLEVEDLPALKYAREKFLQCTEAARFKEYRGRRAGQKEKNKLIEHVLRTSDQKQAPCVKSLTTAVIKDESIGFGGRCKIIYEATRAGLTENDICMVFLQHEDPARYGVLERDERPKPNECGYRINEKYLPSTFSDCGCDRPELSGFCQFERCYRRNLEKSQEQLNGPSFEEFQAKARRNLEEFFR